MDAREDKTYIKDIIEGFENDFHRIVENFYKSNPELKLDGFFKFWTEKSLDSLFANRFDPRELLESITRINQFLVKIVIDSEDVKQVVVALYFLLCLYMKQPERFRCKIRLTCDDAIHIQKTVSRYSEKDNRDVKFTWHQLRRLRAFNLVEERIIYGPSLLYREDKRVNNAETSNEQTTLAGQRDSIEFLESKIEQTMVGIQTMLHPYNELKKNLGLDEQTQGSSSNETCSNIQELLNEAKNLLYQYKDSVE